MATSRLKRTRQADRRQISTANAPEVTPATRSQLPNIAYTRREVSAMYAKWDLVADALAGQEAIKLGGSKYLPMPRVEDDEQENKNRYTNYLERAIWYNATRRTSDGLMGEVFSRDPERNLPAELEALVNNIDGAGTSLDQMAKLGLATDMGFGFGGFLVDYPDTNGEPVTVEMKQRKGFRPTITLFGPKTIKNWRTVFRGGEQIYDFVMLMETLSDSNDGYEIKYVERYRELRLINGVYTIRIWNYERDENGNLENVVKFAEYVPRDADGNTFDTILFFPFGVNSNNEFPDNPPLYDLAVLNIGHYRNSADYEESCFVTGQPTAWFSGLTKEWVEDVYKGRTVYLGARAVVPLPQGAQAGLLQVKENSMPMEAMKHKEAQMAALGAKLIDSNSSQRTFGEAQLEQSASSSILATVAKNISLAVTLSLKAAYRFENATDGAGDAITYDLNTDFPSTHLTPNERAELILEWQAGAITFVEMRSGMRRAGVAYVKDDIAQKEGEDTVKRLAELQTVKTTNPANGGSNDPKLNQGNGGGNQAGN